LREVRNSGGLKANLVRGYGAKVYGSRFEKIDSPMQQIREVVLGAVKGFRIHSDKIRA